MLCCSMFIGGCASVGEGLNDIASGITPKTPREAAESALNMDDPDRRREGVLLLSTSDIGGGEVYVALYREYVTHERDPMVKAVSIRALARHGEPSDAVLIAAHLKDEIHHVRWEAAKGLQRLHNPQVVMALLEVLRNESEPPQIRTAIAVALGQYPEGQVFHGLVGVLSARELSVNLAARQSLGILTGQDFNLDDRRWLEWYNQVSPGGNAFVQRQDYYFPTYSRDLSFFEKVTFWSRPRFESPGLPVGFKSLGQKSTYQDEESSESPPD